MSKEQVFLSMVATGELEIDSDGRVWRLAKRGGRPDRGSFAVRPCERVRAEYMQRQGYLLVAATVGGVKTVASAHRVVWVSIHGEIPPGMTINHKNGQKDDNRPENLELATMSEQRRHAIDVLGVAVSRPMGSRHPKTFLKESDVARMRQMRANGATVKDIAEAFGMKTRAVSAICTRKTWGHV